MAEKPFQERTEQATPKRREDAKKRGQVGKSRELASLAVLASGTLFLFFGAQSMVHSMGGVIRSGLAAVPALKDTESGVVVACRDAVENTLHLLLPFMGVLVLVAVLANLAQTGFLFSVEPLAPKASKINPIAGAKRILSKRSLVELAKAVAKLVIVGWAAFSVLKEELGALTELLYQEDAQILRYMGDAAFRITVRSCMVIGVLAVLDYLYQRWEFEQSLKMTKQEVKEEFKHTEGDPLIKARIRSIQREMARRRMMEAVKKADVVITNPTHLSVALAYEVSKMRAPKVVAKGADKLALRIRERAETHGVPLFESKMLAQNLYKSVDIGEEIPSGFYRAVAEVLAYVYSLKRRGESRKER